MFSKKYYKSKGDWFDKDTFALLVEDYTNRDRVGFTEFGLFEGIKDGKLDEEVCNFDEFDIVTRDEWEKIQAETSKP